MIQIEHLSKTYHNPSASGDAHHALHDVSFDIADGEVFGIIGASGAGKSTLVRCVNLLERPSSGRIIIDGVDVTGFTGKSLLELRAGMGMIFQSFSLFQQRTVLQNVTFPLELRHDPKAHREARAFELLELVGLTDKAKSYPAQLSGGQQQRVAIARALANSPKIMLCDEATSALDTRTTASILALLKDINQKLGVTMLVITHALSVADKICDKVAVIDKGRLVEMGATAQVFANPQSNVTKELLDSRIRLATAALSEEPAVLATIEASGEQDLARSGASEEPRGFGAAERKGF
ncbi:MAG: ATP-binding cassette domain-containing protein [Coriobacteriaceae bacterium]|jgi:D-methionine transport system ATP-binding protein|nr:ATP-binding cassette domain-containing protein [Coriobacteriaceae bacterium]